MTLKPMYRKCPKCKKTYSWNPDVGKMFCPGCGSLSSSGKWDFPAKHSLWDILGKKNNK